MKAEPYSNPDFWRQEPIRDDFNRASDFDTWLDKLFGEE
jgi:hypothetical protein